MLPHSTRALPSAGIRFPLTTQYLHYRFIVKFPSFSPIFTRNPRFRSTDKQPWEGYRVMFNGDQGRLELEVVESSHRTPIVKGGDTSGATHGEKALPNEGHQKITLQQLWKTKEDVPFKSGTGGHGKLSHSMYWSKLIIRWRRRCYVGSNLWPSTRSGGEVNCCH